MSNVRPSTQSFGEWLRTQREAQGLPLRKVAAHLDVDTSIVAKMEKNTRPTTRRQLELLAQLFGANLEELLVMYLSDRVAYDLLDERCSEAVLQAAEQKIKYLRQKSLVQGEIEF
ncbi:MAG: XRE family transcriptional regulator [Cytophagia bacterium]|nr:MAG: XRE family transcriptional regulator [Cytophagales bacterium]TAG37415.1 MAG: XRE family transcriptional regulator [Cytophagia bacterium]TAG71972.1 MAG: XRE family transcriptional regulator [Runella slithyformis]TAG78456.1 MAG: XRE family transcriptional regulator [Cytophagales bacterium]